MIDFGISIRKIYKNWTNKILCSYFSIGLNAFITLRMDRGHILMAYKANRL